MEGVWNFLNGTVTIVWLAQRIFQPSRAHTCIPAGQQRAHASCMQILDALRSDHALYACVHLAQLECITAHFGAVFAARRPRASRQPAIQRFLRSSQ